MVATASVALTINREATLSVDKTGAVVAVGSSTSFLFTVGGKLPTLYKAYFRTDTDIVSCYWDSWNNGKIRLHCRGVKTGSVVVHVLLRDSKTLQTVAAADVLVCVGDGGGITTSVTALTLQTDDEALLLVNCGGSLPARFTFSYTTDSDTTDTVQAEWGDWVDDTTCSIRLTGVSVGEDILCLQLLDADTRQIKAAAFVSVQIAPRAVLTASADRVSVAEGCSAYVYITADGDLPYDLDFYYYTPNVSIADCKWELRYGAGCGLWIEGIGAGEVELQLSLRDNATGATVARTTLPVTVQATRALRPSVGSLQTRVGGSETVTIEGGLSGYLSCSYAGKVCSVSHSGNTYTVLGKATGSEVLTFRQTDPNTGSTSQTVVTVTVDPALTVRTTGNTAMSVGSSTTLTFTLTGSLPADWTPRFHLVTPCAQLIGYTAEENTFTVTLEGTQPGTCYLTLNLTDNATGSSFSFGSVQCTVEERIPGDADNSRSIDAADARLALRFSVGLETVESMHAQSGDPAYNSVLAMDVDGNGTVEAADARLILRASVALEDPLTWLQ